MVIELAEYQMYYDIDHSTVDKAQFHRYAPMKTLGDVVIEDDIEGIHIDDESLLRNYVDLRCESLLDGKMWGRAAKWLYTSISSNLKRVRRRP